MGQGSQIYGAALLPFMGSQMYGVAIYGAGIYGAALYGI